MKVTAQFIGTDDLELELTIRMPLKHWKELQATLTEKWPAWQFGRYIHDAVYRAERQVTAHSDDNLKGMVPPASGGEVTSTT